MRHHSRASILTIEDEAAVRLSIINYLEDRDFRVIEAENGRIGLEMFRKESPDLVLVDLRMPEVDGLEVLAEISESSPSTPIIVISGTGVIADAIESLHLGAWDYIFKPIKDMGFLFHSIEKALDRARLIREKQEYHNHLETAVVRRTKALEKSTRKLRQEISARSQTERKLERSEKMLDSVIRSVPDIIYRLDPHGRISFISDAIRKYGYTPDELMGKNIFDIVHPKDREKARFHINERRTGTRRTRNFIVRLMTRNNRSVPFELQCRPVSMDPVFLVEAEGLYDSEIPRVMAFLGTQGIARDITLRKLAEDELQAREEQLRATLESTADGILVVGNNGRILNTNARFDEFWHIPEAVLESKDERKLFHHIVDQLVEPRAFLSTVQELSQTFEKSSDTLYFKDGRVCEYYYCPLVLGGSIAGRVWCFRDISEKVRLESQLRQAQKMEALGTLAGGIAHDFNNILSAIMGNTQLLKLSIAKDNPARKELENIHTASRRARELVSQILAFSRQSDQERHPIRISLVVREALRLLKATLPSTIEIHQLIEDDDYTVLADPSQIHQVLMNLCTNAHHSIGDKGGVLEVSLSHLNVDSNGPPEPECPDLEPGAWVRLSVADTGHGMDAFTLQCIFDPYFTTKEKGVGTGLGLAMVHGIVESHGGQIRVHSEPGKGATFHVFLPRVEGQAEAEAEISGPIPMGNNERVLFVDDENMLVYLGKRTLTNFGYQVVATTRPQEALKAFNANPDSFDLLITDMTMPKMTGDVLAKEVLKQRPDMPIIICSGFSEMLANGKAKAIGIRDCLVKPVDIYILAKTIRKVLDASP